MPAVPVLTKQQAEQQAEHQAVIMYMVAEHLRRQEEDLMQMVFRLNAAVQHQGGQVVSSEDAGAQRQGGQVVSADLLEAQRQGWQVVSTAVSAPVPGMRSGVRVVHLAGTRQCKWRPRFWMRVISLATFCPQFKSPKAGMFCVTCSSTSSMKTVSLQLVL